AGADTQTSAEIAAAAARIVVQKDGTSTCTREELLREFSLNHKTIDSLKSLETLVNLYKKEGKKIVFTNGCFDILHPGHVDYLTRAKSRGDILIVGMN